MVYRREFGYWEKAKRFKQLQLKEGRNQAYSYSHWRDLRFSWTTHWHFRSHKSHSVLNVYSQLPWWSTPKSLHRPTFPGPSSQIMNKSNSCYFLNDCWMLLCCCSFLITTSMFDLPFLIQYLKSQSQYFCLAETAISAQVNRKFSSLISIHRAVSFPVTV